MATKLKNLHIRKVDFVDEGANQRADIKIAKKKDADPETGISVRESTMKRFMRAIGKAVGITDDYLVSFMKSAKYVTNCDRTAAACTHSVSRSQTFRFIHCLFEIISHLSSLLTL